jgi:hypothetical protein
MPGVSAPIKAYRVAMQRAYPLQLPLQHPPLFSQNPGQSFVQTVHLGVIFEVEVPDHL